MPTGPFKSLGVFTVTDHTGNKPSFGASSKIKVVKSTSNYIKYIRKDARVNPTLRHAKVVYTGNGMWQASVGGFQTISVSR